MTEPMLVVKNLCLDILKDGKPLPILRDVSFEIHDVFGNRRDTTLVPIRFDGEHTITVPD